nr:MAG TPA: hypothetical protein [Caudoviricetes sp.]
MINKIYRLQHSLGAVAKPNEEIINERDYWQR